jgi:hypothetical protein
MCVEHYAACHKWVLIMGLHFVCLLWNSAIDQSGSNRRKSASVRTRTPFAHLPTTINLFLQCLLEHLSQYGRSPLK